MALNTLITEPKDYSKKAIDIYKSFGRVYFWPDVKQKDKKRVLKGTNIIVIGINLQIDKKLIDQMLNLKIIASPATGLNHIDIPYIKEKRIKLVSLRGRKSFLKNVPSTAEETIGLIFALLRRFSWSFDYVKKGGWDRIEWRGHQLLDKTIGLLGFGRLGKLVAGYARAFKMNVIAHDPYVSKKTMISYGVKAVSKKDIFKLSDIVSLHVLLTDDTHDLVSEQDFRLMKREAFFINTARAELIKGDSLFKALEGGWIKGAAIDVMRDERGDGSHLKKDPLWVYAKKNKNLLIVPHIGGATYEAMHTTQDFIAELVKKYLKK